MSDERASTLLVSILSLVPALSVCLIATAHTSPIRLTISAPIKEVKVSPLNERIIFGARNVTASNNTDILTASLDGSSYGLILRQTDFPVVGNVDISHCFAYSDVADRLFLRNNLDGKIYTSSIDGSELGPINDGDGLEGAITNGHMALDEVNKRVYQRASHYTWGIFL